jgi:hypothetical protein
MDRTSRAEPQVRAWAEQHGCSLRVLNNGHHWLIEKPGFVAEWWPSSAKLVLLVRHLSGPPPPETRLGANTQPMRLTAIDGPQCIHRL